MHFEHLTNSSRTHLWLLIALSSGHWKIAPSIFSKLSSRWIKSAHSPSPPKHLNLLWSFSINSEKSSSRFRRNKSYFTEFKRKARNEKRATFLSNSRSGLAPFSLLIPKCSRFVWNTSSTKSWWPRATPSENNELGSATAVLARAYRLLLLLCEPLLLKTPFSFEF